MYFYMLQMDWYSAVHISASFFLFCLSFFGTEMNKKNIHNNFQELNKRTWERKINDDFVNIYNVYGVYLFTWWMAECDFLNIASFRNV